MAKKLYNTATGQQEINPLDRLNNPLDPNTPLGSTYDIVPGSPSEQVTSIAGYNEDFTGTFMDNVPYESSAEGLAQSWGNKLANSITRGTASGLLNLTEPITASAGYLLAKGGWNDAARTMDDFYAGANDFLQKELELETGDKDPNAGLWDNIASFDMVEGVFKSVSEFAVAGMGAGAVVRRLGIAAMSLGTTLEGVAVGSRAARAASKAALGTGRALGGTGRALELPFGINSEILAKAFVSNAYEGKVMANQYQEEQEALYADILLNPYASTQDRAMIQKQIEQGGRNLQALNLLMIGSNVIGFKAFGGNIGAAINKPGGFKEIMKRGVTTGIGEAFEEETQSILQAGITIDAQQDIEAEYAELNKDNLPPVAQELKDRGILGSENYLLSRIDPEAGRELALNTSLGTAGFLVQHALKAETLAEAFAGFVGGGPQWAVTSLPGVISGGARKKQQANYDRQELYRAGIDNLMGSLAKDDFMNEAGLQEALTHLRQVATVDESNKYMFDAVEQYAIRNTVLRGVANGEVAMLFDYFAQDSKDIDRKVASGEFSITDGEKAKKRNRIGKEYLQKVKNLGSYSNAAQLIALETLKQATLAGDKIMEGTEGLVPPGGGATPGGATSRAMATPGAPSPVASETESADSVGTGPASHETPIFQINNYEADFILQGDDLKSVLIPIMARIEMDPNVAVPTARKATIDKAFNSFMLVDMELAQDGSESNKKKLFANTSGTTTAEVKDSVARLFGFTGEDFGVLPADPKKKPLIVEEEEEGTVDELFDEDFEMDKTVEETIEEAEATPVQVNLLPFDVSDDFRESIAKITGASKVNPANSKGMFMQLIGKINADIKEAKGVSAQAAAHRMKRADAKYTRLKGKMNGTTRKRLLNRTLSKLISAQQTTNDPYVWQKMEDVIATIRRRKAELLKGDSTGAETMTTKAEKKNALAEKEEKEPENAETEEADKFFTDNEFDDDEVGDNADNEFDADQEFEEAVVVEDDDEAGDPNLEDELFGDASSDETQSASRALKSLEGKELARAVIQQMRKEDIENGNENNMNSLINVTRQLRSAKDVLTRRKMTGAKSDPSTFHKEENQEKQLTNSQITKILSQLTNAIKLAQDIKEDPNYVPEEAFLASIYTELGEDMTGEAQAVVQLVLSAYKGTSLGNVENIRKKKPARIDADAPFEYTSDEGTIGFHNYTVRSYNISHNAIAMIRFGEARDFNKVKKGDKVVFEVMDDNHPEINAQLVTVQGLKVPITWQAFKDGLVDTGDGIMAYKGDDTMTLEGMRPIRVRKTDGTIIGFVRTTQWATKPRGEEAEKQIDKDQGMMQVVLFRDSITRKLRKNNFVGGTITDRKANIKKEGSVITGAAVNRSAGNLQPVGAAIFEDVPVTFSVLSEMTSDKIINVQGFEDNTEVAVPEYLQNDKFKGTPVIMYPVEDTGLTQVSQLISTHIGKDFMDHIQNIVGNLMQFTGKSNANKKQKLGMLSAMTSIQGESGSIMASPQGIIKLLGSLVNIRFTPTAGYNYQSLRIGARAESSAEAIREAAEKSDKTGVPKSPNTDILVLEFTLGTTTRRIKYLYGGEMVELSNNKKVKAYAVHIHPDPSSDNPQTAALIPAIEEFNVDFQDDTTPIEEGDVVDFISNLEENERPFRNIDYYSIISSQGASNDKENVKQTDVPIATIEEGTEGLTKGKRIFTRRRGDYVKEVMRVHTLTDLNPPAKTEKGNYTFHVNTIVTMTTDPVKDKKITKENDKKSADTTKKAEKIKEKRTALEEVAYLDKVTNYFTGKLAWARKALEAKPEGTVVPDKFLSKINLAVQEYGYKPKNIELLTRSQQPGFTLEELETLLKSVLTSAKNKKKTAQKHADGIRSMITVRPMASVFDDDNQDDPFADEEWSDEDWEEEIAEETPDAPPEEITEEELSEDQLSEVIGEGTSDITKKLLERIKKNGQMKESPSPKVNLVEDGKVTDTGVDVAADKVPTVNPAEVKPAPINTKEHGIAKRILNKFARKYTTGKLVPNATETVAMMRNISSSMAIIMQNMTEDDYLDMNSFAEVRDAAANLFYADIMSGKSRVEAYQKELAKDPIGNKTSLLKAEQTIEVFANLLKAKSPEFSLILERGLNHGLLELGYDKNDEKTKSQQSTDLLDTQDNDIEAWQLINYNILKDPRDGVSSRVKAKLGSVKKFRYENDEVVEDTDILGSPAFEQGSVVYIRMAALLAPLPDNNMGTKETFLADKVEYLKLNPETSMEEYYLVDMLDMLSNEQARFAFTEREKAQFNTAFNKDQLIMEGVVEVTRTGKDGKPEVKLVAKNYSFNTRLQEVLIHIQNFLANAKQNKVMGAEEDHTAIKHVLFPPRAPGTKSVTIPLAKYNNVDGVLELVEDYETGKLDTFLHPDNLKNLQLSYLSNVLMKLGGSYVDLMKKTAILGTRNEVNNSLTGLRADISTEISRRLGNMVRATGLSLASSIEATIREDLTYNKKVPVYAGQDFTGNEASLPVIVDGAIENLVKLGFGNTQGKPGTPNSRLMTFFSYVAQKAADVVQSAIVRVGIKSAGNFVDPLAFYQRFKKFNSQKFSQEVEGDIYKRHSILYRIQREFRVTEDDNTKWLGDLFTRSPKSAGLLSTWRSDIDSDDGPLEHAIFNLSKYFISIDLAKPRKEQKLGSNYSEITILGKKFKVRPGAFGAGAMSDKDNVNTVRGMDFSAYEKTKEGAVLKKENLELYVDQTLTPELNRILALGKYTTKKDPINVNGYEGSIVFAYADLNTYLDEERLLERLGVDSIPSLFALKSLKGDQAIARNRLIDLATKQGERHIQRAYNKYVNHLVQSKVLRVVEEGVYALGHAVSDNIQFRKLWYTKARQAEIYGESAAIYNTEQKETATNDIAGFYVSVAASLKEGGFNHIGELLDPKNDKTFPSIIAAPEVLGYIKQLVNNIYNEDSEYHRSFTDALNGEGTVQDRLREFNRLSESFSFPLLGKTLTAKTKNKNMLLETILGDTEVDVKDAVKDLLGMEVVSEQQYNFPIIDPAKMQEVLGNYVYSYGFNFSNLQQLFYGDLASFHTQAKENKGKVVGAKGYNYKADIKATQTNLGKRMAKEVSPAVFSEGSKKYMTIYIKDPYRKSKYYGEGNEYGIEDIGSIQSMDAGAAVTMEGRSEFLVAEGVIYEHERKHLHKFWEGKITPEQLKRRIGRNDISKMYATTDKPRVVGERRVQLGDSGLHVTVPVYDKMAMTVLSQNLNGTNSKSFSGKLLKVIEQVQKQTGMTVRAVPSSGAKVGATKYLLDIDKVEEVDGVMLVRNNWEELEAIDDRYGAVSSYEFFGRQQRTDPKSKSVIKATGQVENMIWNNIGYDKSYTLAHTNKKPKSIRSYWDKINRLLHDTGMEGFKAYFKNYVDPNAITDMVNNDAAYYKYSTANNDEYTDEQLARIIKASMIAQSKIHPDVQNRYKLQWLEIDPKTKKFREPLSNSPYFTTFMYILKKTLENKTSSAKREGYTAPLMSDEKVDLSPEGIASSGITMFKGVELGEREMPNGEIIPVLRPALPGKKRKDGSFDDSNPATPAQILIKLDSNLHKLIKELGTDTFNIEDLPAEIRSQMGYRTPTQDYNMMSYVQVVGILPDSYPNTVVAPAEFVNTMGSDFDIDKLFAYRYSLINYKGKIEVIGNKHYLQDKKLLVKYLNNEKLRILQTVLSDPKIVREELAKQLNGEDAFKKFGNELYSQTQGTVDLNEDESYLFPSYQEIKRNNASGAKQGVASFAKLGRVYAQFKGKKIPVFLSEKKVMTPKTLELGHFKVKEWASDDRNELFKDTDERHGKTEWYFDSTKDNISAFISLSVDDEKLQLLHKFGLDDFRPFSALMLLGLRAKSGLAMLNMPMYQDNFLTASKMRDKLYEMYNSLQGGQKKISLGKYSELTDPKEFSIFKAPAHTVDSKGNKIPGQIDEMDAVASMMKLSKRLKVAFEGGSATDLDILDGIRLMAFVSKAETAYKNSITPVGKLVNLDSKGIPADLEVVYKVQRFVSDGNPVWAELQRIPEIKRHSEVLTEYVERINALMDPWVRATYDILGRSNIIVTSPYSIAEAFNVKRFTSTKPDITGLLDRIRSVLHSLDPAVIEFRESNEFLKRLKPKQATIHFDNSGTTEDNDIIDGLEFLATHGDVGGIDMSILHQDLVNFILTATGLNQGNSYLNYIDPKYYSFADDEKSPVVIQDLAAYVAYQSFTNKKLKNPDKIYTPKEAAATALAPDQILMVQDKLTREVSVWYSDQHGIGKSFTRQDFLRYTKQTEEEASQALSNSPSEGVYEVEPTDTPEEGVVAPVQEVTLTNSQINATIERLFPRKGGLKLKKMFKIMFPQEAKIVLTNHNEWDAVNKVMSIDKGKIKSGEAQGVFVHELTHAVIMEALTKWVNNELPTGVNPDDVFIAEELAAIFTRLNEAKTDVTDNIAEIMGDPDFDSMLFSREGAITGTLMVAFNNIYSITDPDSLNNLRAEFGEDKAGLNTVSDIVHYIVKNGLYGVNANAATANDSQLFITDKSGRVINFPLDSRVDNTFLKLLNTLKNTYYKGDDVEKDYKVYATNKDIKTKESLYFDFMYGLTNIHEFLSQGYRHGTRAAIGAVSVPGYQEILTNYGKKKQYQPVADEKLPGTISSLYRKLKEAIKKILVAILGDVKGNLLYKDIMYSQILVNPNSVLDVTEEVDKDGVPDWIPYGETKEILNCNI